MEPGPESLMEVFEYITHKLHWTTYVAVFICCAWIFLRHRRYQRWKKEEKQEGEKAERGFHNKY